MKNEKKISLDELHKNNAVTLLTEEQKLTIKGSGAEINQIQNIYYSPIDEASKDAAYFD